MSPDYKQALAKRLVMDCMTRMGGFIFLMNRILDFADQGGRLVNEHGAAIYIHPDVVEEAYGYELSFSWTTDIKGFAARKPCRQSPGKHLLRLHLWDAAYKLAGGPFTAAVSTPASCGSYHRLRSPAAVFWCLAVAMGTTRTGGASKGTSSLALTLLQRHLRMRGQPTESLPISSGCKLTPLSFHRIGTNGSTSFLNTHFSVR